MISNMKDCFVSPIDNITNTTLRTTTTTEQKFIKDEHNDSVTTTSLSSSSSDDDDDDDDDNSTTTVSSTVSSTTSYKQQQNNNNNNNNNINNNILPLPLLIPPPMLRLDAWSEPSAENYSVRGKTYIKDKIKQPSTESAFKLFAVDIINVDTPMYSGICSHPNERIQIALQREKNNEREEEEKEKEDNTTTGDGGDDIQKNDELNLLLPEFIFAINLCIPKAAVADGSVSGGLFYHAVFYFGANKEQMNDIKQCTTPFGRVMNKYIFGSNNNNDNNDNNDNDNNEYRNKTLKLIPHVIEGNYIIKHAVGTKPTILGKEMKQYYVQDERYIEVIIDISSNTIANSITKLCLGYINNLVIDLMFVIEGHDELTLPERILGGVQIKHLDFITKNKGDGKRTVTC